MRNRFGFCMMFLGLIAAITFLFLSFETKGTVSTFTEEEAREAIINEAYAFYHRGDYFQYDDNAMTYLFDTLNNHRIRKRRSDYIHQPEDGTSQDIQYFVCSEFFHNVYYNVFRDSNGNGYVTRKSDGSFAWYTALQVALDTNVRVYYKYNANGLNSDIETISREIKEVLQPGDAIIYTRSDGGHAMLYVGQDEFGNIPENMDDRYILHATGSSYSYGKKRDYIDSSDNNGTVEGVVLLVKVGDVFKDGSYMFKRNDYTQIAILRPLNKIMTGGYTFSSTVAKRREYPLLVREKTASVNRHQSVNPGEKITYTISLKNRSKNTTYKNVAITDTVPTNTTYLSCTGNCTKSGSSLSWSVNVSPGGEETVSYTVKVKDGTIGKVITSDKTMAGGIKLNTITTTVNKSLSSVAQETLANNAKKLAGSTSYAYSRTFIQDVYRRTFGDDKLEFNFASSEITTDNILKMFYNTDLFINYDNPPELPGTIEKLGETGVKRIYRLKTTFDSNDSVYTNMYVKGLFGGIYTGAINENNFDANLLARTDDRPIIKDGREFTYDNNTLMVGDILVIYDDDYGNEPDSTIQIASEKNMYLYLGNGDFATVPTDTKKVTIYSNTRNGCSRLIDSLLGQNAFIVLRPSYSMNDLSILDKLEFGDLSVDDDKKIIKDINVGDKYSSILNKITTTGSVSLISNDGSTISSTSKVKTGDKIKITLSNNTLTYTVSVVGDLDGDGEIKINDVSKLYRYLKGKTNLTDIYLAAGEIVLDNEIKISDVSRLYRYLKGKVSILRQ